ncbi:MAG: HAD family hydrolase [Polaromonas sp.]|uniref:HAD family hydrolase n=1 Tax=Polaromonas sp. TaxID=1869339 RepID=UPI00271EE0C6|nr:HAD family hydrolase [Polaromonas sp.]MDO9114766.1 HAD family hydrolase [Polaromonas sp.]MDP1885498.1 HAD family hydrolase [Polaromonas sp.]
MLDLTIIKAITLDLDDTLWPVWPVIEKAEAALDEWLGRHAPMTAALFANPTARHDIREQIVRTRPELRHNLSAIRREAIRLALYRSRENPLLAEEAFEVFFSARHEVTLFDDAMLALEFLSARYPVVALSNGNADIARIGLAPYFRAAISAQAFGVGKPDPRIFHAAAGAVDVQPYNVLHVGDDAALDVLGALNAGMQTAWVNRADHLWSHDAVPHETVTSLTELCDLLRLADPQP